MRGHRGHAGRHEPGAGCRRDGRSSGIVHGRILHCHPGPRLIAERLPGEPDPALTPGALNPEVTPATIDSTICLKGWTASVRPSEDYTESLKVRQIEAYGYTDRRLSSYEEDHLVPLSLGGATSDPRNLWPEPISSYLPDGRPSGADQKDDLELRLNHDVCSGTVQLAVAQAEMLHWVHSYYGIPMPGSTTGNPAPSARPTAHYWYCWNVGSPLPHHLGKPTSGDHACTDTELTAAGLAP